MDRKSVFFTFILFTVLISITVTSSLAYGQGSQSKDSLSTSEPEQGMLLKQILSNASLTNIQTISRVDGIKVSEVKVGDNDITFTIENTLSKKDSSKIPITVAVLKIPGSSIEDTLVLLKSVGKLQMGNSSMPETALIGQLSDVLESNTHPANALQNLIQIGLTTEMGLVHIVGENWKKPRVVSTALIDLPTLLGMADRPDIKGQSNFVAIIIVPYAGKTSIASVPLR